MACRPSCAECAGLPVLNSDCGVVVCLPKICYGTVFLLCAFLYVCVCVCVCGGGGGSGGGEVLVSIYFLLSSS